MHTVPLTQRAAKEWIQTHHRHLDAPVGDLFRVAAARMVDGEEQIVGVAIVGRPKARALQDGRTCEVTRLAVPDGGGKNVCSFLYARCAEIARALGYRRIFTYTLEGESGRSLVASGWTEDGMRTGDREWDAPSRPRQRGKLPTGPKTRWVKNL